MKIENLNIRPGDYVKAQPGGYTYEAQLDFRHFYFVIDIDTNRSCPRVLVAIKPHLKKLYSFEYVTHNPSRFAIKYAQENPNDSYVWIIRSTIVEWKGYLTSR